MTQRNATLASAFGAVPLWSLLALFTAATGSRAAASSLRP